jgi:hypothetical protein
MINGRYAQKSGRFAEPAQFTYPAVKALTDSFCHDSGGDEYRDLARAMTPALCRAPVSL